MDKLEGVKRALWNPQTRTCLGRTSDSWLKIIAFYICLYSSLAAIWSMYYGIFHLTISDKYPKWILGESIIGTNPGVGMRPTNPRPSVESALIKYREGADVKEVREYVTSIREFLAEEAKCRDANNNQTINCNAKKTEEEARETFCPFDSSAIPPDCQAAQNFSFLLGQPCILIKLNRIYGWRPEPYQEGERPPNYPEGAHFAPGNIQITCEGQHDPDKEHLGPVEYYPPGGLDLKYYPFFNQPGYQSPYVMVHFKNPRRNTLIYIECKAWAKNVEHDRYSRKGLTMFELFIER